MADELVNQLTNIQPPQFSALDLIIKCPWVSGSSTTNPGANTYGDSQNMFVGDFITKIAANFKPIAIAGAVAAAFGTAGVLFSQAAYTQTDSTTGISTVAAAYGSLAGANTFATASNAITITNGYNWYFQAPVAGSHVTGTNLWALGADSALINGALKVTGTVNGVAAIWSGNATAAGLIATGATVINGLYNVSANNPGLGAGTTAVANWTTSLFTLSQALNYGGVTLSNSVTGTGSMVLSASPTFTGTVSGSVASFSSTVSDAAGDLRTTPVNSQTTGYTLVASDYGKQVSTTTGVTVPNSVFSAGQAVVIYNNSSSSITITQGTSVTMYLAGTATTGNRTLAQRGICVVTCVVNSSTFTIGGSGLT